jgi:hypothetical protein
MAGTASWQVELTFSPFRRTRWVDLLIQRRASAIGFRPLGANPYADRLPEIGGGEPHNIRHAERRTRDKRPYPARGLVSAQPILPTLVLARPPRTRAPVGSGPPRRSGSAGKRRVMGT